MKLSVLSFACAAALAISGLASAETVTRGMAEAGMSPDRGNHGDAANKDPNELNGDHVKYAGRPGSRQNDPIAYHNGPILHGPKVYYIWYGNWTGNTATTILTNFVQNLGGSAYFNINTTYYDIVGSTKTFYNNILTYGGSTNTSSSTYGTSLSDSQIQSVVSDAIASASLPKDTNAVYLVLTSADVTASSGFCTQYCGWHTHGTISGSDIKYGFVGNADRCPSSCAAQSASSPNNNIGADGMASVIAHEIEETVTDPDLNGWYNGNWENGDKCAWTFGTESTASNGSKYNVTLGGSQYLIQQNWIAPAGGCAMHL
ncbi:MAG: hypothetical protein E6K53_04640 [Gammaproteobacteria bacterium]|nr:MAG: hypothetical protein E6K53_04640 [Gammaproteobacteria bacterium]